MQLLKNQPQYSVVAHAWNTNVQAIEANLGYLHSEVRVCVGYIEKPCLKNENNGWGGGLVGKLLALPTDLSSIPRTHIF